MMRHRARTDLLFRLTFTLPVAAAILLLGSLGLIGIADWCGAGALCNTLWTVFLGAAAALLALALVIRVAFLVAAALGLVVVATQRAAHGAALVIRTTLRGL
jgi:hypothetical protein